MVMAACELKAYLVNKNKVIGSLFEGPSDIRPCPVKIGLVCLIVLIY